MLFIANLARAKSNPLRDYEHSMIDAIVRMNPSFCRAEV